MIGSSGGTGGSGTGAIRCGLGRNGAALGHI